jgi:hypothetical protein
MRFSAGGQACIAALIRESSNHSKPTEKRRNAGLTPAGSQKNAGMQA